MTLPTGFKITTELLLRAALFFALLDAVLLPLLAWRIKPAAFRQLKTALPLITALYWCLLWFWVLINFWEPVYSYLFPAWSRWLLPFFQALLTAAVAAGACRASRWFRIHPLVSYVLMGGLWGVVSHLWAVVVGVVDKPPMLQGASPAAAVTIAFFEFMFYWCVILAITALVHPIPRFLSARIHRHAAPS